MMTFEELKAEAAAQGYNLIKKQKYIKLEKCPVCGKKPVVWFAAYGCKIACCDKEVYMKNERQARMAWNEFVKGMDHGN